MNFNSWERFFYTNFDFSWAWYSFLFLQHRASDDEDGDDGVAGACDGARVGAVCALLRATDGLTGLA